MNLGLWNAGHVVEAQKFALVFRRRQGYKRQHSELNEAREYPLHVGLLGPFLFAESETDTRIVRSMTPFLADPILDVDAAIEALPSNGACQSFKTETGPPVQQPLHLTQHRTKWLDYKAVA